MQLNVQLSLFVHVKIQKCKSLNMEQEKFDEAETQDLKNITGF